MHTARMFLLLVSFLILPGASAHACSVMAGWPPSSSAYAAEQDLVFAGVVQDVVRDKSIYGDYHITFTDLAVYKGEIETSVRVRVPGSSAACGYDDGATTFEKGSAWVIYAAGTATDGFTTTSVGLNKEYDTIIEARTALAQIGGAQTIPSQDLTQGARGADVKWLQGFLITKNTGSKAQALKTAGATSYYGTLTKAALAEFQAAQGITPSLGYYGAKTRALLQARMNIPDNGEISIEGTTTCLPPRDPSKPTIMLCALGLQGNDGHYYALSYNDSKESASAQGMVRITGVFTQGSHDTWKSVGTIAVQSTTAL